MEWGRPPRTAPLAPVWGNRLHHAACRSDPDPTSRVPLSLDPGGVPRVRTPDGDRAFPSRASRRGPFPPDGAVPGRAVGLLAQRRQSPLPGEAPGDELTRDACARLSLELPAGQLL